MIEKIDITDFLVQNCDPLLKKFKEAKNTPRPVELDYFFDEQYKDYVVKTTKEFLLEHYPELLEEIHLTVDYDYVRIVLGGNYDS